MLELLWILGLSLFGVSIGSLFICALLGAVDWLTGDWEDQGE